MLFARLMRSIITLRRQPVSKLCEFLTNSLAAITVVETGMDGRYDIDVPYQAGDLSVTLDALRNLGLEAIKMKQNVNILVIVPEDSALEKIQ
jgi:hypothetical protein